MRRGVPHTAKSSDQMPEEAPAQQVPEDVPEAPEGAARESVRLHTKAKGGGGAGRRESERGDRAGNGNGNGKHSVK